MIWRISQLMVTKVELKAIKLHNYKLTHFYNITNIPNLQYSCTLYTNNYDVTSDLVAHSFYTCMISIY